MVYNKFPLQSCNETDRDAWLYNRQSNYVDFSMDENGLWVVYTRKGYPHLMVSKLEIEDFRVVSTWELDVNGTDFADAFIMSDFALFASVIG